MKVTTNRQAGNLPENGYPDKTFLRSLGLYPMKGFTEEESNYFGGMMLMEMLMEGKTTMFTHEGECLNPEDAARIAANAWNTDAVKLTVKALEWEPLLKLRRDDPDRYRSEMSKRTREMVEEVEE